MLGSAVCAIAAFRLRGTPLQTAALVLLAASIAASAWAFLSAGRAGAGVPRLATATRHVVAALGAFFLFVSFALP